MKPRRMFLLALLLALLLFTGMIPSPGADGPAMASCAEMIPVERAYEKYDGIVLATVVNIGDFRGMPELHLSVLNSFKGVDTAELTVLEDAWRGFSQSGETYLFFLRQMQTGGWQHPLCSPTVPAGHAGSMLEFLQDKEIPLRSDSATSGAQGSELSPGGGKHADPPKARSGVGFVQPKHGYGWSALFIVMLQLAAACCLAVISHRTRR